MSEPYATQDSDYLSTHRAQTSTAHTASAGNGPTVSSSDSTSRASHNAPPTYLSTVSNDSQVEGSSSNGGTSANGINTSDTQDTNSSSGNNPSMFDAKGSCNSSSITAGPTQGNVDSCSSSSFGAITSTETQVTHGVSLEISTCQQSTPSIMRTSDSVNSSNSSSSSGVISRSSSNNSSRNSAGGTLASEADNTQIAFGQTWPHMSCGPTPMTNATPEACGHVVASLARRESEILLRAGRTVAHVVTRGTKRRGSDSSVVLMALSSNDQPRDISAQHIHRTNTAASGFSSCSSKRKRGMLTAHADGLASNPATLGRTGEGLAPEQLSNGLQDVQKTYGRTSGNYSEASRSAPISETAAATNASKSSAPSADCSRPRGDRAPRDRLEAPTESGMHILPLQRGRANSVCGRRRQSGKEAAADVDLPTRRTANSRTRAAASPSAPVPVSAHIPTSLHTQGVAQPQPQQLQTLAALPPINRYTLRELKIQNILQNPRLRHEVLFEPKLEFRPNSSGQLAEAKQRAAHQYWAVVQQGLKTDTGLSTIAMLVVELREILAEMAEDTPKSDMARHAIELRERLDEVRIRQQLAHGVFDVNAVVTYLSSVMSEFAPGERHAAVIAKMGSYVACGRVVRGLRLAFDVLESIKIDVANSSIEMYREYMRATAVAFERSHFNLSLRRGSVNGLSETREWWTRALSETRGSGSSLDTIFFKVARDMILDDGAPVPALFRMDDARIISVRREAERLAIVGTVFLSFGQFLQAVSRTQPPRTVLQTPEFRNAAGKVDYARLAAECLQLLPESCSVQWTEPLRSSAAPAAPTTAGEIPLSRLVADLIRLAERALGRTTLPAETAMLERTLLRAARYECPLREVVEERVSAAIRTHSETLAAQRAKARGTSCEAMPQSAVEVLQKSKLDFLQAALSTLTLRIHTVLAHHWLVYKPFYALNPTSSSTVTLETKVTETTIV